MSLKEASLIAVATSSETEEDNDSAEQEHQEASSLGPKLGYFPLSAFAAIFGFILCWILMGVVLFKSHDETPDNWFDYWGPQPAVYLSVLSVLSNACIHSAYKRGYAIQWWIKVDNLKIVSSESQEQKKERKKADNLWKSSHSFTFAVMSIWLKNTTFSILSLACIVLTILPASAPLLQRASYVGSSNLTYPTVLQIQTRVVLPSNFTGIINDAGHPSGLTPAFTDITNAFSQDLSNFDLLDGICQSSLCNGTVPGVGLAFECSHHTENISFDSTSNSATIFNVSFSSPGVNNSLISMSVVSKGEGTEDTGGSCSFPTKSTTCTFSPAEIDYKMSTDGYTIFLEPNTSYVNDIVLNHTLYQPNDWSGIFLYIHNLWKSSVTMSYENGLDTNPSGILALLYAKNSTAPACQQTWDDPTDDLLQQVRQLMFLTATYPPLNDEDRETRRVNSTDNYQPAVFQSDYRFLALSMIVSGLSLLVFFIMTWRWKSLNRKVNLSPSAFGELLNARHQQQEKGEREKLRKVGLKGGFKEVGKAFYEQFDNYLNN